MKQRSLLICLLVNIFYIFCAHSSLANIEENKIWEDYLGAKQTGKVLNIVDYIKSIYTLTADISEQELLTRQQTIYYFLSTGGKYGFRQTQATPEENLILVNSLMFLGMIDAKLSDSSIDCNLSYTRRLYGKNEEDKRIQKHLSLSYKFYAIGKVLGNWHLEHNPNYIKILFSHNYVLPRLIQEFQRYDKKADISEEINLFTNDITPSVTQAAIKLWNTLSTVKMGGEGNEPITTEEVELLKDVVCSFTNIIQDSLSYEIPVALYFSGETLPFEEFGRPSVSTRSERPFVVTLKDGSVFIKRVDNTVYCEPTCSFQEVDKYYNIRKEFEKSDKSDETFLKLLKKISPVIHQFYYGKLEDYADLTSLTVWPEAFPRRIVCPFTQFVEPPSRETPDADLINQLVADNLKECEMGIHKLSSRLCQSILISTEGLISTLSQIKDHLQKLATLEIGTDRYSDYCNEVYDALGFIIRDWDMRSQLQLNFHDTQATKESKEHAEKILKMTYVFVKKLETGLQKIRHLACPISNARYPSQEKYESKDVALDALPSYEIIEEGEAEVKRTSANLLEIFAKTNDTVITFENFWIGQNSLLTVHLPNDDAVISLYQRSGKPSFIFGQLEHEKGFIKLYAPNGRISKGTHTLRRMLVSGGVYQPKRDRKYRLDLTNFYPRSTVEDIDFSLEDLNFMETPDGKFEQELIAFRKKEISNLSANSDYQIEGFPNNLDDYQDFIRVCQRYYEQDKIPLAQESLALTQNNLAGYLYRKSQTLPLKGQIPLLEEVTKLFAAANENGYRSAQSQVSASKLAIGVVCGRVAEEEFRVNNDFDQSVKYYKLAIATLETVEQSGDIDVSSQRAIAQNNLGIILVEKAVSILNSPERDSLLAYSETLLTEAENLTWSANFHCKDARELRGTISQIKNELQRLGIKRVGDTDLSRKTKASFTRQVSQRPEAEADSNIEKMIVYNISNIRSFLRKHPEAKSAEYLPVYSKILSDVRYDCDTKEKVVEAYSHPDLIMLYFQQTKKANQLFLKQLSSDEYFMKEQAIEFFPSYLSALNQLDRGIALNIITASPYISLELMSTITK